MELLISLAIITLAILGGLYAVGLILVAVIGPPIVKDEVDLYCTCERCEH